VTETKSRRRGTELEQAILDAAWAELREVGYADLTIEGVATRAGTSKPVIYRRWPGRPALVLAAWARQAPVPQRTPDTGDLRSDLLALFTRIARRADAMMSAMIAGVMAEAFRDPEVIALLRERLEASPLSGAIGTIVRRAVDRGELPPVRLPARAKRLPVDLIRNESMTCGTSITRETITEFVDDVYLPLLRGLASTPSGLAGDLAG
jgi:AcrR family transcriptional regulator